MASPPFGTYSSTVAAVATLLGLSFFPFSFEKKLLRKDEKGKNNKFFNFLKPVKMEFQNENGTAAKNAEAKDTNNQTGGATAKANNAKTTQTKANGKTGAKNLRPPVPGSEKDDHAGLPQGEEMQDGKTGLNEQENLNASGTEKAGETQGLENKQNGDEVANQPGSQNNGQGHDAKNGSDAHESNANQGLSKIGATNGEALNNFNVLESNLPKPEPKPELTLDAKLKAIGDLNRKSIQRLTLIARIQLLEDFEIKLFEGADELTNNVYQGCKLIIEDDKKNQFTTNTPGLIRLVSQYIYDACVEKLQEIESTIVFPQA
jgi:hypothetical protein